MCCTVAKHGFEVAAPHRREVLAGAARGVAFRCGLTLTGTTRPCARRQGCKTGQIGCFLTDLRDGTGTVPRMVTCCNSTFAGQSLAPAPSENAALHRHRAPVCHEGSLNSSFFGRPVGHRHTGRLRHRRLRRWSKNRRARRAGSGHRGGCRIPPVVDPPCAGYGPSVRKHGAPAVLRMIPGTGVPADGSAGSSVPAAHSLAVGVLPDSRALRCASKVVH